mmetsp:Transcript_22436/g.76210  ORF Transcript_22436/g.76210 Transcript_22436/m.76210 type:complete len:402 (+) Transcript_22436:122-1327(+)
MLNASSILNVDIRCSALLAAHFLETYAQVSVRLSYGFINKLLYQAFGYQWKWGELYPVKIGSPFLTRLLFWLNITYVVCEKRLIFHSLQRVAQKEFVQQFGVKTPRTIASITKERLLNNEVNLPHGDFVLKSKENTGHTPIFIVQKGADIARKVPTGLTDIQQQLLHTPSQCNEYLIEELLLDEMSRSCPPSKYKVFVLGKRILKIFYFTTTYDGPSVSYNVACIDENHERCETSWLRTDIKNLISDFELPAKPKCWGEMLAAAIILGSEIETFSLLNFYATTCGAVFGGISYDFNEWAWSKECSYELQMIYDELRPEEKDSMLPDPFSPPTSNKAKTTGQFKYKYIYFTDHSIAQIFFFVVLPLYMQDRRLICCFAIFGMIWHVVQRCLGLESYKGIGLI